MSAHREPANRLWKRRVARLSDDWQLGLIGNSGDTQPVTADDCTITPHAVVYRDLRIESEIDFCDVDFCDANSRTGATGGSTGRLFDPAFANCKTHGLAAITDPQLVEDIVHVILDRVE